MDTERAGTARTTAELEAGVDEVRQSPRDRGTLELAVVRPAVDERRVLDEVHFDTEHGVVGDTWNVRPTSSSPLPNPEAQVTLMNARAATLIAGGRTRWPLAGDQLYVDLDLSGEHLPPGSRLQIGTAVLEVSAKPHTGCAKFSARFGSDAFRFVNSPVGRALNLRGVNARVVASGVAHAGLEVLKLLP
ncbi:MAG: MOSC domain-containing protein [Acidimicrobiia bacterium]